MTECCICFNSSYMTKTNCNHSICVNCLMDLRKIECPMCRRNLTSELPERLLKYLLIKNKPNDKDKPFHMIMNDLGEFPPL